jgi:deazaflavin-dependent oxidoreductase (nitroreductase family)
MRKKSDPRSGGWQLAGLSGNMSITIEDGTHFHEIERETSGAVCVGEAKRLEEEGDMANLIYKQNRLQRTLQYVPASALGSAVFSKFMHRVDAQLMRASGGRFSLPILLLGLPIVNLTSTGAKSGKARTMPVIGVPDGRNIALVASSWGQEKNPAWYYNLRANPVAELSFGGQTGTYIAREVTDPEEYQRLWQQANQVYLAFDKYQQRAANRKIPVMLLDPQV